MITASVAFETRSKSARGRSPSLESSPNAAIGRNGHPWARSARVRDASPDIRPRHTADRSERAIRIVALVQHVVQYGKCRDVVSRSVSCVQVHDHIAADRGGQIRVIAEAIDTALYDRFGTERPAVRQRVIDDQS
jgi:hypothetical protein